MSVDVCVVEWVRVYESELCKIICYTLSLFRPTFLFLFSPFSPIETLVCCKCSLCLTLQLSISFALHIMEHKLAYECRI